VLEVLGHGPRADVDRAGDGHIGPAGRGQFQHVHLAAGEVGQAVGLGGHRRPGPVPRGRAPQRVAHRRHDRAQHPAVLLAELPARPAQRDADLFAIARAGHGERDLVVGRDMAEVLRVNPQPAKSLPADHVADLGRPAAAAPMAGHERVLGEVILVDLERRRVQAARRIFDVITENVRLGIHFLVCRDIAADQLGQSRQHELGRPVRLVQVRETVHELRGSSQCIQRNVHGCASPRGH
jgi:hypothetical protein